MGVREMGLGKRNLGKGRASSWIGGSGWWYRGPGGPDPVADYITEAKDFPTGAFPGFPGASPVFGACLGTIPRLPWAAQQGAS